MTRQDYEAQRTQRRERAGLRTDRGLSQHPAFGWLVCPECEGAGELEQARGAADPNPRVWCCESCNGDGQVWDSPRSPDPIVEMAGHRRAMRLSVWRFAIYHAIRRHAMRPARLPHEAAPALRWAA